MKIVLKGEVPSKKNSRINTRSGRSFPSRRYSLWHDSALLQLRDQNIKPALEGQKKIIFIFFHGDKKRRDSDNQCSSVLDLLVDAGIIEDDCWTVIPIKEIYDYFDKNQARCEIYIDSIRG